LAVIKYTKDTFVKHPTADWGIGRVVADSSKESVSAVFEKVGYKTIKLSLIEPLIVNYESEIGRNKFNDFIKLRIYFSETFEDIYNDLKSKAPEHLVIIENGTYFEVINDDAEKCRTLYGWKVYSRAKNQALTGFPVAYKSVFYDLEGKKISYILVSQISHKTKNIERQVDRIYTA
jgi:MutS domain I